MPQETGTFTSLEATARWTAAVRAAESTRADGLCHDPWAAALAGEEGLAWMAQRPADRMAPIALRTRFFDDFLQRITCDHHIDQVVMVAAGLDTRAFRLDWPAGTHIFELDHASVLEHKAQVLQQAGAEPSCARSAIEVDLGGAWAEQLIAASFSPQNPSLWLLEGLLFYLSDEHLQRILDEVTSLAAPGSFLAFDVVNHLTLTHPLTRDWLDMQARSGAPWLGALDDPVAYLSDRGWQASLTQPGQPDANHGRWPYPVYPPTMPDLPHHWLVTAHKET
jgi:methyltransferase (TIGR00027 family)